MSDELALLDAISAEPDEDLPRLVLADWLEEHGDEQDRLRAGFIRLQCELARLPEDAARRAVLEQREQALLTDHRAAWSGLPPDRVWPDWPPFARGFVERSYLPSSPREYLADADVLARLAPVQMIEFPNEWEQGVDPLRWRATDDDFAQLAAHPGLSRWQRLQLCREDLSPERFRVLVTSPHLHNLRRLEVCHSPIGAGGLAALANTPTLPSLRELELSYLGPALDDEDLARGLAAATGLNALARLTVTFGTLSDPACAAFVGSRLVRRVTSLELDFDGPVPATRLLGLGTPGMALKRLLVWSRGFTAGALDDGTALALVTSPHLAGVISWSLNSSELTDDTTFALLGSPAESEWEELELGEWMTDATLLALAGSPRVRHLRRLSLMGRFGAEALRALVASSYLERLEALEIRGGAFDDDVLALVAGGDCLPSLREFRPDGCSPSDATLGRLRERFGSDWDP
jgi:uncharacterized protein (TIGR02996 family)